MDIGVTQSITELQQAEQNFKYAAPEFVAIAIMQLLAARMKVDILLRLKKQSGATPIDP
ncbi:hypothetical protein LL037_24985 [Clostridium estertheticum]|nr:hypothetical protein [Clostridium estertheticum]MBU3154384.1 hypothetical protein [Clostridium estertheticum]MBU3197850.1 hypothetical protein [Clostridium estertheticum]WAG65650.1 hypothetical protein LL037_24985 [Clostridium estertheticum]